MQVAIACRHGTIDDGVHEFITRKSEKLLTYFERVTAIEVTVDFSADRVNVELLVDAEHKHNFVSSDVGSDVSGTFDKALQKMEHQIRKYKEKLQDHRRVRPTNEVAEDEALLGESESE